MNQAKRPALINTLLQQGVGWRNVVVNRFNGFSCSFVETVETVPGTAWPSDTLLKQGVNETASLATFVA
jgi:hypothetical protein